MIAKPASYFDVQANQKGLADRLKTKSNKQSPLTALATPDIVNLLAELNQTVAEYIQNHQHEVANPKSGNPVEVLHHLLSGRTVSPKDKAAMEKSVPGFSALLAKFTNKIWTAECQKTFRSLIQNHENTWFFGGTTENLQKTLDKNIALLQAVKQALPKSDKPLAPENMQPPELEINA